MNQDIKTKKLSSDEIIKIINTDDVEQLIGLEETSDFEFKEFSYKTTSPGDDKHKAHMELAKDITAISNVGGGVLCIGLKSAQKSSVNIEYVDSVSGINEVDINMQSWSAIISDWITPRFSISYLKYGFMGKSKKVFWIQIPNAKEIGQFPFIIAKDQYSPDKDITIKGRIFGYYTRDGAEDLLLAPDKIQKYIADGLKAEYEPPNPIKDTNQISNEVQTLGLKLDSLSSQISNLPVVAISQQIDYDEMGKKIVEYANTRIGGDYGYFYIYAIPKMKQEIKDFWDKGENSVYHSMTHTPTLRNMGWSLEVHISEYPYPKENSWEVMNGDRKLLIVKKTGEVFAAGAIDGFLDWGSEESESNKGDGIRFVNAFAFTEYIDTYFHYLDGFKKQFSIKSDYIIKMGFVYPDNAKLAMRRPAHLGSLFDEASKIITQKSWEFEIPADDPRTPPAVAGQIVVEINASGFGWAAEDQYKYLKKSVDGYEVDEDFYRKNVTI